MILSSCGNHVSIVGFGEIKRRPSNGAAFYFKEDTFLKGVFFLLQLSYPDIPVTDRFTRVAMIL